MTICLYSPYIPKHHGGGEKYLFTVAQSLAKKTLVYMAISSHDALSPTQNIKLRQIYEKFLGEKLHKNINFIASPLGTDASFWNKLQWTKKFDVLYYATDGSLFFSLAKKNILHIQIPFTNLLWKPLDRLKLWNWQVKNTNSHFTKRVIEKKWFTKVNYVHYPVIVNPQLPTKTKKKKIILNVGRFFSHLHSKRQDVLVDIFAKLNAKDWTLVLAGSVEDEFYLQTVKDRAQGLNVKIMTGISRASLIELYKEASIYWHATGYGVDEVAEPAKCEHFGISTVEAMSFGAAPIVINKGGQKEILSGLLRKWLWNDQEECVTLTKQLINNERQLNRVANIALKRAEEFSEKKFESTLWKMING